jgi:serine/threonine protein phosphatase PrpC
VFLCSDGLCGPIVDKEFAAAFAAGPVAPALDDLIARALSLSAGHADNATGIAMRYGDDEEAHDTEEVVSHVLEIP